MTTAILAEPEPASTGHCLHCGTDVATGERFCCVGCGAVHRLLSPGESEAFRKNAGSLENRAVFEIPELLEGILERRVQSG